MVQGFLFGMSQAQAHAWIHRPTRVLNRALGDERQLPEREPANLETVLSACPSLAVIIDGTERPINRPKDKDDRKKDLLQWQAKDAHGQEPDDQPPGWQGAVFERHR